MLLLSETEMFTIESCKEKKKVFCEILNNQLHQLHLCIFSTLGIYVQKYNYL